MSPEKAHLRVKPLSKLSLGVDMKLCRDIGPSSKAIRLQLADQRTESADVPPRKDHEVKEALPRWQKTAQDELVASQDLEIRNRESQLMLLALQKESTRLEKENSRLCIELWGLNDRMESSRQQAQKVSETFQDRSEVCCMVTCSVLRCLCPSSDGDHRDGDLPVQVHNLHAVQFAHKSY